MFGLEVRNGKAYMFSRRDIPFHKLGYVSQNDSDTAEDVLKHAKLNDWNVRLQSLGDIVNENYSTEAINKSLVIRDNPELSEYPEEQPYDVIGVVSSNFHIMQNEEVLELGQEMTQYGARIETAGSLKNGAVVFYSLALEAEVTIDESGVNEKINSYLVLANGHDGSTALHAAVTPIRPLCTNTLNMAIANAKQSFKIRHSKNMASRIQAAKSAMTYAADYTEKFAGEMNALHQKSITDKQFDEMIERIYERPEIENKRGTTIWNTRRNDLWNIYDSPTVEPVRGTLYGALQAITENDQWGRRVHNDNIEAFYAAGAGFDNAANVERNRIYSLVKSF